MDSEERRGREELRKQHMAWLIARQPYLFFFTFYGVTFVSMSAALDLFGDPYQPFKRYLLPLPIATPLWVNLRRWAIGNQREQAARAAAANFGPGAADPAGVTLPSPGTSPGSSYTARR